MASSVALLWTPSFEMMEKPTKRELNIDRVHPGPPPDDEVDEWKPFGINRLQ